MASSSYEIRSLDLLQETLPIHSCQTATTNSVSQLLRLAARECRLLRLALTQHCVSEIVAQLRRTEEIDCIPVPSLERGCASRCDASQTFKVKLHHGFVIGHET